MDTLTKTFGKLTIPLLLLLAISFFGLPAQAKYGGGKGTPEEPYQIRDANHMQAIGADANDWDKHFKLMADIDLGGFTGTEFNIIGTFTGVFDGNAHTISHFTYTSTDRDNIGLFGYVDSLGEIKDLGLIAPDVDAGTGYYVGSLVGHLSDGTITNCYVEVGRVSGQRFVGALVGDNDGPITNCYSTTSVSGGSFVGGLVGGNDGPVTNSYSTTSVSGGSFVGGLVGDNDGPITNSYSTGTVSGVNHVGGIVGYNYGTITNCYSTGTVSGNSSVGGLVGYNRVTITNSYSEGNVLGTTDVGGLVGLNYGTISNCYSKGSVTGTTDVGGLVGYNDYGIIANCYSTGSVEGNAAVGGLVGVDWYGSVSSCYSTGSVGGHYWVGGLVGGNWGSISNCYSTGSVSGEQSVGGLVGRNSGSVSNCYSTGDVSGGSNVGGLVGLNDLSSISNCYSTGSVSGEKSVGGLVGHNWHASVSSCYSTGDVSGSMEVGGLVGYNNGSISSCYSTSDVSGDRFVGGLVGENNGSVSNCFWDTDTQTHGVTDSIAYNYHGTVTNVAGLSTAQMQTKNTFADAGWDFATPVWTIDEGVDYPRLWWELVPVLHAEPEVTLGTTNTISWAPVVGGVDYYAECAEDANFTSILSNTGWITETSFEFTGLQLCKRYWYSVKARNIAGVETGWSNVESSLQGTLGDAVEVMLDPDTLKNKNMKNALLNKINTVQQMLDKGRYEEALNKLRNDILQKTDGCADTGRPDKNDWIITCEVQNQIYPLIMETIEYVKSLMK